MRVYIGDTLARGNELRPADVLRAVQDLSLEISDIDVVEVHEAERADPRGGEIERRRRPEPARADQQDACGLEFLLSVNPDIGEDEMAAVAEQLVLSKCGHGSASRDRRHDDDLVAVARWLRSRPAAGRRRRSRRR